MLLSAELQRHGRAETEKNKFLCVQRNPVELNHMSATFRCAILCTYTYMHCTEQKNALNADVYTAHKGKITSNKNYFSIKMLYSLASPAAAAAALVQVSKRMFHNENISKLKLNGMTEIEK